MNELDLFTAALALTDPAERAALFNRECAGDAALRERIEALLAAHDASGGLVGDPSEQGTGAYTPVPGGGTADFRPDVQPGVVIAGRYSLEQKLGEGGMGEVWVAKQSEPVKRRVALKLIKAGMDSKAVLQRFEQERQALALMEHPNIARVIDGGLTDDRRPFFVMELVNGLPLTKFCDDAKLTPKDRLELFVPICHAVQHAHQKGIVHRDLKPSNILVTMIDGRPVPKVIDFGVAKATSGKLTDESLSTQFGAVVGTLEYMSPEQAGFSGQDVDTRADIYSLGVILYELLTGLRPIDAKRIKLAAFGEMIRIIQEEEPSKPSTRLSTDESMPSLAALRQIEPKKLMAMLRGELDCVVMKCLEKQRDRRYETANGLARDIQRYLADEPVEARPARAGYRFKKYLRRNKVQALAASLVMLALCVGIVGTTSGLFHANSQRRLAETAQANEAEQRHIAQEEKAKAEKAEADTLADYRASTDDAIEQLIGSKPALGPQERTFLENTLKRWRVFAAREGDDERSRAIRAEGHSRVARLWQRLGRKEEARTEYLVARDLYQMLAVEFPAVNVHRSQLANTHNNLGILLADLGKGEEARTEYRAALELQRTLVEQFPDAPNHRQELANTHNSLGLLQVGFGRREEGREEYLAARDLFKKLVDQFPAVTAYQQELATVRNGLGALLVGLGKGEDARVEFLAARDLQTKLVAQFPAMPLHQQDLARTHNNLGILLAVLGRRDDARTEYMAARDLRKSLAGQFPAVPARRQELARTHDNLGLLLTSLGKREEARVECMAARELQRKLVEQFPDVPAHPQELAATHNHLGILLKDLGQGEAARAEYQSARDIQKKLVEQFPAAPAHLEALAMTHNNLGILFRSLGKRAEARIEYQAAIDMQKKLVEQFPAVPAHRINLGGGYSNFGNMIRDEGQPAESLEWFDLAVLTLQPIHEKEPRDATARQFLLNSHWGRALAYDGLRKLAESAEDWDRAIELSPSIERPRYRASRAVSKIQAGLVSEAVADVAELTKAPVADAPGSPRWIAGQWYDFACVYAVASGRIAGKQQEYADRSMELLRKAERAGYTDAVHMAKDDDLTPLRERDDFKKLLADLATKGAANPERKP